MVVLCLFLHPNTTHHFHFSSFSHGALYVTVLTLVKNVKNVLSFISYDYYVNMSIKPPYRSIKTFEPHLKGFARYFNSDI